MVMVRHHRVVLVEGNDSLITHARPLALLQVHSLILQVRAGGVDTESLLGVGGWRGAMAGQYVVQRWNVTVGWGYGRQRARQGEEWARRFQRRLVATVGLGCSCCEGPLVRHHH